jgi:type I restriction enzyme R subunit
LPSQRTEIIERYRTVGWQHDRDLQNRIRSAIDGFFFDRLSHRARSTMEPDVIDMIADDVLASARVRMVDDGRIR